MKKSLILLTLLLLIGCAVPPTPKYRLTMIYPDGTTKVFEGVSVRRDNTTGEWSYTKPVEQNDKSLEQSNRTFYFKGKAICEPILDLTPAPEEVPIKAEQEPVVSPR
jgi:hypothetical protein